MRPFAYARTATLEEALEIALAERASNGTSKNWRNVIGMFRDSDFMREVDEECRRSRESERVAARNGATAE